MDVAVAAFFLAPGLAIGSFLNVLAARLPLKLLGAIVSVSVKPLWAG